jgi:hypothetical protein
MLKGLGSREWVPSVWIPRGWILRSWISRILISAGESFFFFITLQPRVE